MKGTRMLPALRAKMIEIDTQDMMIAGSDPEAAARQARSAAARCEDLQARALIALNLCITYASKDDPNVPPARATEEDLRNWYSTPPGKLDPEQFGAPAFRQSVTTAILENAIRVKAEDRAASDAMPCTRIHLGNDFEWCLSDHLDMLKNSMFIGHRSLYPSVPFPHTLARQAFEQFDTQPADETSAPVNPDDEPRDAILAGGYETRQDLEDKLHLIAALVDQQQPFGTDLANFKRRLQRVLG